MGVKEEDHQKEGNGSQSILKKLGKRNHTKDVWLKRDINNG